MQYAPRRKLTREFKLEAVRQVALSDKPKAQLARELGVRVGQLRTWRLEFEKEAVTGIAKPDRSAAEDLEQLRRENAKLKMEIEILKKAAAGSTIQRNTFVLMPHFREGGMYGSSGTPWSFRLPEVGALATLESRGIA
jgi:transposase